MHYKLLCEHRPELIKEWHPKNKENPKTIGLYSNKKVWWICKRGHEYEAAVYARSRDYQRSTGCPECWRFPKKGESIPEKYPEKAKTWHPTLNPDLNINEISFGSTTKAWWKCDIEETHVWEQEVCARLRYGCPFCTSSRIHITNCLATIRPDLISFWHPTKNGNLTPYDVTSQSDKKIWWICSKEHEWETSVRTKYVYGCPYCNNSRIDSSNCLETTHPEISKQWNYEKNYPKTPKDVVAGSRTCYWWNCEKDPEHIWKARICSRTAPIPHGCRFCKFVSRGEEKIDKYLKTKNISYIREYTFSDCRNKSLLYFDFTIFDKENKPIYIIEYNGKQHYEPIKYFGGEKSFNSLVENDNIKIEYCKSKNINLIIIPYSNFTKIENILDKEIKIEMCGLINENH